MAAEITSETKDNISRCVIIGGGDILDYSAVSAHISADDFIICADSGYDHCAALGISANIVVGDFDSLRSEVPPSIPRIQLPPEKNYTDTMHAVHEAVKLGYNHIFMTGMLGGRLDHTFANLQSLAFLAEQNIHVLLTDGVTHAYCIHNCGITLPKQENCYFSLLPLSGTCTGVNIVGAKYLLHNHTLHPSLPRAVSNEFLESDAEISVGNGTLLILVVPKN